MGRLGGRNKGVRRLGGQMKNWWAVIATRIDQQMKGWNAPKGQLTDGQNQFCISLARVLKLGCSDSIYPVKTPTIPSSLITSTLWKTRCPSDASRTQYWNLSI